MADRLDLSAEVRDLFEQKLQEFAAFCAEHWTLTDRDMAELHGAKGPQFKDGYNTALTDGLTGAIAHWLGEDDL